jgi:phosphoribosylaminoimidazolecarboxamide formyltransferase / IMP cyclohydrolase
MSSSSSSYLPSLSGSALDFVPLRRALLSVYDKRSLLPVAQALSDAGVEIISTGGTASFLSANGIPHQSIESLTHFPEILSGRVKSLHPLIHGGLLAVRGLEEHEKDIKQQNIKTIDLVISNLYPFQQAAAAASNSSAGSSPFDLAVENIDIGGPTLIRSSAKNHRYVCVLTSPEQYQAFLKELDANRSASSDGSIGTGLSYRRRLASEAFHLTAEYEKAIANFFDQQLNDNGTQQS